MRLLLRLTAVVLLLGAGGWWLRTGRNPGWTKNQVAVEKLDGITGITWTDYEPRFVPGLDFLAGASALAGVLGALSLLRRKPR